MPVRIADSMKQQNDLDTFPVAYGADIWLDKNKGEDPANYKSLQAMYNDDELGGGGSSIQVETIPAASAENVGKIVQYVGATGSYKKGHFYECVHNSCDAVQPVYRWIDVSNYRYNHVVYNQTTEPINSDFIAGDIIYYTGVLTDKFKPNHYYRALPSIGTMEKYTFTMYRSTYGGMVFWSYTPFEFRQGFIVYPTSGGGEWEPYEITSITDEKVTITPYGDWGGEPLEFDGVLYTSEVKDWEELEGGGGTSIFYGTMDEWDALTTDEKKQYDYMTDNDAGGSYIDAYSTSEVKTNKVWIDGKPIYRKVVSLSATKRVNNESYTNLGITFPNDADTMFLPIVVSFYGDILYYNSYKPIQAACRAEVDLVSGTNFILEYTKTTD